MRGPGRRVPVVRGELLVVAVLGRELVATALAIAAEHGGVAGDLDVGHVEVLAPPREPRIAQLVVDDGEGLVGEGGIDVIRPQRPALV